MNTQRLAAQLVDRQRGRRPHVVRRLVVGVVIAVMLAASVVAVPPAPPAAANPTCEVFNELRSPVYAGGGQKQSAIISLPAGATLRVGGMQMTKSTLDSGNWDGGWMNLWKLAPDGSKGDFVDQDPFQGPGYYWNSNVQFVNTSNFKVTNLTGQDDQFWFEMAIGGTINIGPADGLMSHTFTKVWVTNSAGAIITDCVITDPSLVAGPDMLSQGYAGDPVNAATGNFTDSWVDISYGAADPLLGFARTYNSSEANLFSPLGQGWSITYDDRIREQGSDVDLTTSSGRLVVFTDDGAGGWDSSGEFSGELVDDGDGTYSVEYVDGTVFDFDANGRVGSVANWAGDTVTIARDTNGRATTATSTTGRSLSFTYGANGRLTTLSTSDGQSMTFTYDTDGNLLDIDHTGNSWEFDVNSEGLISEIRDGEARVVVSNVYDADTLRVTEQTTSHGGTVSFAYDDTLKVTTVTDNASGDATSYTYDSNYRITGMTDPLSESTARTWDTDGGLASATDREGNTISTSVNPLGQLEQFTNADGTATVDRDTEGRVIRTVGTDGLETLFAYTGSNRIPDTIAGPDGTATITQSGGRVTSIADPAGGTYSYGYDTGGNLTSQTDPTGLVTSYTYDGAGRVLTATTPDGAVTTNTYGPTGLLASTDHPATGTTTFAYNGAGQLTSTTDDTGATTAYTYTTAGEIATVTDPGGAVTTYGYSTAGDLTTVTDHNGDVTTYTYGALGRVTAITDPGGGQRTMTYDDNGQVASVTDANGETTSYTYDAIGRIATETTPTGASNSYTYDTAGRTLSVTDLAGAVTSYTYDTAGRVATMTDPTGNVTTIGYDNASRVTSRSYSDGTSVTFTYDTAGRRLTMVDPTGTTSYTYDTNGQLDTVTDPTGAQIGYDWANGQLSAITYPDGSVVDYTYTSRGQLDTVTHPDLGGVIDYTYNPAGQLTATALPGGESRGYTYNPAGQITGYTQSLNGGAQDATLTYNPNGDLASVTTGGNTTTYTYDTARQLTGADSDTYTYDKGRRTSVNTTTNDATYTYNNASQITSYTNNNPGGGGGGGGAGGGSAHVIVGDDVTVDPGDQEIIDRLTNELGYTVTVVDDGAPENVAGADVVVITHTVGTNQMIGNYIDETVPLLTMSTYTWDEHNLVANQSASYPFASSDTLDIQQPTHPTVDGSVAPHASTVSNIGYALDTDVPTDADIVAATKAANPERAAVIAFDTGDLDADGVAVPERRVLLGYHRNTPANLTETGGWHIFDNTINWLNPTTPPPPPPAGGSAHVIVGDDVTVDPGDQEIIDRLTNELGYTVTVVDDGAPENVAGADVVVITHTVGTNQMIGNYIDETVPLLTMSTYTWDEHNLVANQSASYPFSSSDTLDIQQATHPTVDGTTAPHATTASNIGYALDTDVPADADIVAAVKTANPERAAVIAFDTGDLDAAGVAVPERRVLLGYHKSTPANLTETGGWAIFDNTINWLNPNTGGGGPVTSTPTYDTAGRLTSIDNTTITYNTQGRIAQLVAADQTGVTTQDRTYNGDGQLVGITITQPGGAVVDHHLVWNHLGPASAVLTHDVDGHTNNYLYGTMREAVNRSNGATSLFATDHLGSTVATLATVDLAVDSGYSDFGTPTTGVEATTIGFGYRGELHVGPTIHLRNRDYLPQYGHFTTLDPLLSVPGKPTTPNPYHYAYNNPVNLVDPLGLRPTDDDFGLDDLANWGMSNRSTIVTIGAAGACIAVSLGTCAALTFGAYMVRQQHRDGSWGLSSADVADGVFTAATFGLVRIPVLAVTKPTAAGLSESDVVVLTLTERLAASGASAAPGIALTGGCRLSPESDFCGRSSSRPS